MSRTKIKKEYWKKGKSKWLEFRPELQSKLDIDISEEFKKKEKETIRKNRERRLRKYGKA